MRSWRKLLAACALLVGVGGCRSQPPIPAKPTVVIILIDTLRADFLGVGGFRGAVSPAIDAIAGDGVVFETCMAQAPWTKPSIASLFTSLHPGVHNVLTESGRFGKRGSGLVADVLADDFATLAEMLKADGYATAAFVANPWVRADHGFAQGFDLFDEALPAGDGAQAKRPAAEVTAAARRWLSALPGEQAAFLYLHYMDVHGPYESPDADFEALAGSESLGPSLELDDRGMRNIPQYLRQSAWVARAHGHDVRTWRARYAAGVRVVDRAVAEVRHLLEETGRYPQALVVVTSDHGEELYDHERWEHGYTLFDEQLHVPLVVKLPGGREAGRRIDDVVSLVDVAPTVLDLLQIAPPPAFEGQSLVGLLSGGAGQNQSFAAGVKWKPYMGSVRTGRFKLISERADRAAQVFDLASDAGELRDIAAHDPAQAAELLRRLTARRDAERARHSGPAPTAVVAPEDAERLRALGYLDKN